MVRMVTRILLLCLLAMPAGAPRAAAQAYGPGGFVLPVPGGGQDLVFGAARDELFWSWFEIGAEVCDRDDARVFLRLGLRRASVPCRDFLHARVDPGPHPRDWGKRSDPIRAEAVTAILSTDPPATLTLQARTERTDRRRREVLRILAGPCDALADGFALCRPPDWPEGRRLIAATAGPRLRDGLPMHMICERAEGREYCLLEDGAPDYGRMQIHMAFPALDAGTLRAVEPLYRAGSAMVEDWAR